MKRYLISMTVVLAVLLTAWAVFAQEAGTSTPAGKDLREKRFRPDVNKSADANRPIMSEEEKAKFRAQMREKFLSGRPLLGREEQMKVIAAIEEQIAKLKSLVEAQIGPEELDKTKELAAEEKAKLREKFAKAREERQKIVETIEQNIAKLRGERPRMEERHQTLITELQAIRDLSKQENAVETTKRLEQLIEKQKELEVRAPGPPPPRLPPPGLPPQGPERMPGPEKETK